VVHQKNKTNGRNQASNGPHKGPRARIDKMKGVIFLIGQFDYAFSCMLFKPLKVWIASAPSEPRKDGSPRTCLRGRQPEAIQA
jgi:hypothetical protein